MSTAKGFPEATSHEDLEPFPLLPLGTSPHVAVAAAASRAVAPPQQHMQQQQQQQQQLPQKSNQTHQPRRRILCRVKGCTKVVKSLGLCQSHGGRTKRCRVEGCQKQAQGVTSHDGMCKRHFKVRMVGYHYTCGDGVSLSITPSLFLVSSSSLTLMPYFHAMPCHNNNKTTTTTMMTLLLYRSHVNHPTCNNPLLHRRKRWYNPLDFRPMIL